MLSVISWTNIASTRFEPLVKQESGLVGSVSHPPSFNRGFIKP